MSEHLYLGIKGHVLCLDKQDGNEVWNTKIKSSNLTNIVVDGELIFAYSAGHLFCLSASDGSIQWKNELPGWGYGYCILAINGSQSVVSAASQIDAQTAAMISAAAAGAAAANDGS